MTMSMVLAILLLCMVSCECTSWASMAGLVTCPAAGLHTRYGTHATRCTASSVLQVMPLLFSKVPRLNG
jgi:hypothetical protein